MGGVENLKSDVGCLYRERIGNSQSLVRLDELSIFTNQARSLMNKKLDFDSMFIATVSLLCA